MKNSNITILNFIKYILTCLIIIIISFNFVVKQKNIYYYCVNYLDIENTSNLTFNEIKLNYDYVIDYLTDNKNGTFNLPTLNSSKDGKYHFKEVKILFNNINSFLKISTIALLIVIVTSKFNFSFIKSSFYCILLFFSILITIFLINFNWAFNIFHKLIFNNNYWLFDEKTDPIILILPQKYFFICAVLIIALSILISSVLNLIYISINKKN